MPKSNPTKQEKNKDKSLSRGIKRPIRPRLLYVYDILDNYDLRVKRTPTRK